MVGSIALEEQLGLQQAVAVEPGAGFDWNAPRRLDDEPADRARDNERPADDDQPDDDPDQRTPGLGHPLGVTLAEMNRYPE